MIKTFRLYDPEQRFLLPPDHLVYFISDVVGEWNSRWYRLRVVVGRSVNLSTSSARSLAWDRGKVRETHEVGCVSSVPAAI